MSNKKHFLPRETIASIIIIILTFSFLITCAIFTPNVKDTYREPQQGYASLEEEYIAAIDSFLYNNSQVVYLPKDSSLIVDNTTITIKDKNSNAQVTCRFVLNGTVPVYEWSYSHPYKTLILLVYIVIVIIFAVILALALCTVANCIFKLYDSRKKRIINNNQNKSVEENNGRNCDIYPCGCKDCEQQDMCDLCPCNDCPQNPDKYNDKNVEDEQVEIEDEDEDEYEYEDEIEDEDEYEDEESDVDENVEHHSIWNRLHDFFVNLMSDSDDDDNLDDDIDEDSDEDLEVLPDEEAENDSYGSSDEDTEVLSDEEFKKDSDEDSDGNLEEFSNEEFEKKSECSSTENDEKSKDVPEVNGSAEKISDNEEPSENDSLETNPKDDSTT